MILERDIIHLLKEKPLLWVMDFFFLSTFSLRGLDTILIFNDSTYEQNIRTTQKINNDN